MIFRGLQGDSSPTEGFPPAGTLDPASFDGFIAERSIAIRESLGEDLLATFGTKWGRFNRLLGGVGHGEWQTPCYHLAGVFPAERFVLFAVQELVFHEWDIRSRIEQGAAVSSAMLPTLMERIPGRFGTAPGYDDFFLDSGGVTSVRYRFQVTGAGPGQWDILVEEQKARMEAAVAGPAEVTFQCDTNTFVVLMYKRLILDPLLTDGSLTGEGDRDLVSVFNHWLKGE